MSACPAWKALPNNVEHMVGAVLEPFRIPTGAVISFNHKTIRDKLKSWVRNVPLAVQLLTYISDSCSRECFHLATDLTCKVIIFIKMPLNLGKPSWEKFYKRPMTPPSSFYKSVGRFWSSFGRFLAVFGCFLDGFWATHRTNQKLPKLFYNGV